MTVRTWGEKSHHSYYVSKFVLEYKIPSTEQLPPPISCISSIQPTARDTQLLFETSPNNTFWSKKQNLQVIDRCKIPGNLSFAE